MFSPTEFKENTAEAHPQQTGIPHWRFNPHDENQQRGGSKAECLSFPFQQAVQIENRRV
jgi:hypothetical protein